MGRFVVLTGIDGAGKDFVADALHEADPTSRVFRTPGEPFQQIRQRVDSITFDSVATHYLFYLSSVVYTSHLIERVLPTRNVYCVRYLLDTVVYHRAMGLPVDLQYQTEIYNIVEPDATVFLGVEENLRVHRVQGRAEVTVGDQILADENFRSKVLQEYNEFADQYTLVDNSRRPVDDVVAEIRLKLPWLNGG